MPRKFMLIALLFLLPATINGLLCPVVRAGPALELTTQNLPLGDAFYLPMQFSPYPYQGKFGDTGIPFFDSYFAKTGEPAHTNRYGEKIPANRYQDNKVLFYLPPEFSPRQPFFYLVFFHGLPSNPGEEFTKHLLARQIKASGKNLILVMPPLASNATDASPGKFFNAGAFNSFINEIATSLAKHFPEDVRRQFNNAPVVISAFSGGYKSVAYIVDRGGIDKRLQGVLLFDALFEDVDKFFNWLQINNSRVFFMLLFGKGSCEINSQLLIKNLQTKKISYATNWPKKLAPGAIHFIKVNTSHEAIPSKGPPADPLTKALTAIPGFTK